MTSLCSMPEYTKRAQTRRLRQVHGGGALCNTTDCQKFAQSRGLCATHGGGRRCAVVGCLKYSQYKGVCLAHGGGRSCSIPGCQKYRQIRSFCKAHAKIHTTVISDTKSPPSANIVRTQHTTSSRLSTSSSASLLAPSETDSPAPSKFTTDTALPLQHIRSVERIFLSLHPKRSVTSSRLSVTTYYQHWASQYLSFRDAPLSPWASPGEVFSSKSLPRR